ncbi:MAG: hypothetical protein J4F39_18980 [Candidatus Latescibacteria bacterium]|nr:hypothetical protein [Candidatus Latescibacterota bacterium]
MNELNRDVGFEILEGFRELRRSEHGRVINVPDLIRNRMEEERIARRIAGRPMDRRPMRCAGGNDGAPIAGAPPI